MGGSGGRAGHRRERAVVAPLPGSGDLARRPSPSGSRGGKRSRFAVSIVLPAKPNRRLISPVIALAAGSPSASASGERRFPLVTGRFSRQKGVRGSRRGLVVGG